MKLESLIKTNKTIAAMTTAITGKRVKFKSGDLTKIEKIKAIAALVRGK